jgi:FkbM family methyltransferase
MGDPQAGVVLSRLDTLNFILGHPLNQGRRLGSLARYTRWQVASRLARGPLVFEWVNGSKLLISAGETGLTGNVYTGLHDLSEMGFLLHVLAHDDLFVDVGANAGSYTVLACAAAGARGIAFEPVPATFERLVRNVRLNDLEQRVVTVNKGVGAEPGEIAFTSGMDTVDHVLAPGERAEAAITVEVTSLDAFLDGRVPAALKIDVEGYEVPVLAGARKTLADDSLHSAIIELNGSGERYGYEDSAIIETMAGYGFGTYAYDPLSRSLERIEGKDPDSMNTLFVRDRARVEERLAAAPVVSVNGVDL